MLVACAAGYSMTRMLVARVKVEPGFAEPPATWFSNDVALGLPVPIVVIHVLGNLPVITCIIATMLTVAFLGWRFVGSLQATRRPLSLLIGAQLLVGLALATFPVTISSDAYGYMLFGHLYGLHQVNPYLQPHLHVDAQGDVQLQRLAHLFGDPLPWRDDYGPLFTLWAASLSRALGSSLGLEFLAQRIAAILAAVGVTLALARLLRNSRERISRVGTFAFHPLVLCETAVNGHNDMMMVALAAGAFAVADMSPLLAGVLFGASIATKIVTVIAFPFLLVAFARKRLMRAVTFAAATSAVVALSFRPFWFGWQTLGGTLHHGYQWFFSPTFLVSFALFGANFNERMTGVALPVLHAVPVLRHASWPQLINFCFLLAFAIAATVFIIRYARTGSIANLWKTMVGFVWSSPVFDPWYFIWISPMISWHGAWPNYAWWMMTAALLYYPLLYGVANGNLSGPLGAAVTGVVFFLPAILLALRRASLRSTAPSPIAYVTMAYRFALRERGSKNAIGRGRERK